MSGTEITQDLYDRGVYCPGSRRIFFKPDPKDPARGICPRCNISIGLLPNQELDDHVVLPEFLVSEETPDIPMPDLKDEFSGERGSVDSQ